MKFLQLHKYEPQEQLKILKELCNKIYIARNITLRQDTILEQLANVDSLFRSSTEDHYEE